MLEHAVEYGLGHRIERSQSHARLVFLRREDDSSRFEVSAHALPAFLEWQQCVIDGGTEPRYIDLRVSAELRDLIRAQ